MKRKANRSVGKVVVPKQLKVADRGYEVLTQDGRHVKSRSQENLLERNESNSGQSCYFANYYYIWCVLKDIEFGCVVVKKMGK